MGFVVCLLPVNICITLFFFRKQFSYLFFPTLFFFFFVLSATGSEEFSEEFSVAEG